MGVMLSDTQNAASAVTLPVHHTRMHARTHMCPGVNLVLCLS